MEQKSSIESNSNRLLYTYRIVDYVDYLITGTIVLYLFNRVAQWQGYTGLIAFVRTHWSGERNVFQQLFYNINDVESALQAFGNATILINLLFFISLMITIIGTVLTVKLHRRKLIPANKAIFRYIWWGIMGPIEALAMLSF